MPSSGSDRNPVERLAEEFAERYRQGERPPLSEYVARYPQYADEIRELFPALVMIEQLKPAAGDPTTASPEEDRAGRDFPRPERLGDYRILREVGRGGMGVVYEAEQVSLGRRVALKVLPAQALLDGRQLSRFEREAKAAARLHHSNIVPVYGVGEQGGLHYYVMQFIQGLGLDQVLEELRRLRRGLAPAGGEGAAPAPLSAAAHGLLTGRPVTPPAAGAAPRDSSGSGIHLSGPSEPSALSETGRHYYRSVARIGVQVAEALAYAHGLGTLHRDIKPSNLLLDAQGVVWVTDFGLAKAEGGGDLTADGEIVGTLRYIPPERFRGRSDARGDVYSLGLTLYELLTLRPAFAGEDRHQLLERILHGEPPRPRQLDPAVPRDLETVVLKAIAKDPARRYQTAAELAEDLKRFVEDRPIHARRAGPAERLGRWCRRNPALAGVTAALLLVFLAGFAGVTWQWLEAEAQGRSATRARGDAEEARTEAETRAEESRRRLVQQYVGNGERLVEEGDLAAALAWFAEALDRDRGDPDREEVHRIRLASIFREYPRLANVWHGPALGGQQEFAQSMISADGRRLLAIDKEGRARVWDVRKQQPFTPPLADSGAVTYGLLSPDGRVAFTGSRDRGGRWWDAETGRPIASPRRDEQTSNPGRETPTHAAFSPDGNLFATSGADGRVELWQVRTGAAAAGPLMHDGPVLRVTFSPDGRRLASAGQDSTVKVWEVATGKLLRTLPHPFPAVFVAFSPDGRRLVTCCHAWGVRGEARLWDDGAEQPRHALRHDAVSAAEVSPDGRQVVTAGLDGKARLWDTSDGKLRATLEHSTFVTSAAFSPDGSRLLTTCLDTTARVWDSATGKPLTPPLRHGSIVWHAAFAADSPQVVAASVDGLVRTWELSAAPPPAVVLRHTSFQARSAFSPDGGLVATTGAEGDNSARLWDVATGRQTARLQHRGSVESVAFSPDGRLVATASTDRTARVWKAATGEAVTPPLLHDYKVMCVAFSPDGRLLATGVGTGNYNDFTGEARVWEIPSGKQRLPPLAHRFGILCVEFSPDGRLLLTAGYGGAHLWETATGREVTPPLPDNSLVNYATFSPDGRRVAMTTHGRARVWQVATGAAVFPALPHGGIVFFVAYSPDGRRLVTASMDHTARLWDAQTGRPLSPPWRHGERVFHASFSPDGRSVATGSMDGWARLWDVTTGQMLALPLHHGSAGGWGRAQFSPDGRHLLTDNLTSDALLWDVSRGPDRRPAADLVAAARVLAGHRVDSHGGLAALAPGELQEAWQTLAARYPPAPAASDSDLTWHRRAAEQCERESQWWGAVAHLNQVLRQDPGRWQDWFARGRAHTALERWDRALADYDRAVALGGDDAQLWFRKGEAHVRLQQCDRALSSLNRAVAADPGHIWAWHHRAIAHNGLRRYDRALADANRSAELGDHSAWLRHHRAVALHGLGRTDEALRDFSTFLASERGLDWCWEMRGEWYVERGKWRQAADDFARAFELNLEKNTLAGYRSALALLQGGDAKGYRARCAALLERAVKEADAVAANNLVWACVVGPGAVDDPNLLVRRMEKVVRDWPGTWVYMNTLGAALYRARRDEDAVRRLSAGVAAHGKGGLPQDWLFLAMAHHRLGMADEARKWLDRAARFLDRPDPRHPATGERDSWSDRIETQLLRREAEAELRRK
jgi:WD40 repeat protein/serine/threonine protein kinase/lipoprotein NlpI